MRPTELLKQEHRTIESLLDRLEWTAIMALKTGSLEVTRARRLVHVLSVFLDRWHRKKEEELLFPLIEERGVLKIVIRAALMQEEHDSGHEELRALEAALDPAAKMDPAAPKTLSCRAVAFVDRVRRHIRKEEEIVFPLAEASLREKDREALCLAFDCIEKSNPFPSIREEIERLIGPLPPERSVVQGATDPSCTEAEQRERPSVGTSPRAGSVGTHRQTPRGLEALHVPRLSWA